MSVAMQHNQVLLRALCSTPERHSRRGDCGKYLKLNSFILFRLTGREAGQILRQKCCTFVAANSAAWAAKSAEKPTL